MNNDEKPAGDELLNDAADEETMDPEFSLAGDMFFSLLTNMGEQWMAHMFMHAFEMSADNSESEDEELHYRTLQSMATDICEEMHLASIPGDDDLVETLDGEENQPVQNMKAPEKISN